MIDYIETQAKDGTPIRIEVESTQKAGTGFGRQSSSADVSGDFAQDAYNQVLSTIRACANGVIDTLQNLDASPSAASIDFAIKIDAEAGAMVAKSMGDAQIKVSLSWKQVEPESVEEDKEQES
jgi:hypothetical protein